MTDVVLETPRLRLSPLTLGDLGALHALFIDADVRRWMADGRVYSEAHVRASIQRSLACFRRNGTGGFALRLREDATFLPVGRDAAAPPGPPLAPGQPHPAAPAFAIVGYAGLFDAKLARLGGLELGAGVWPRFWRTGLAAEACRAVLDDAFGRLDQARVLACTDAPNFRSLALIARLGFRQIATTPGVFGAVRWFALDRYGRQVTPTSRLGVTSG